MMWRKEGRKNQRKDWGRKGRKKHKDLLTSSDWRGTWALSPVTTVIENDSDEKFDPLPKILTGRLAKTESPVILNLHNALLKPWSFQGWTLEKITGSALTGAERLMTFLLKFKPITKPIQENPIPRLSWLIYGYPNPHSILSPNSFLYLFFFIKGAWITRPQFSSLFFLSFPCLFPLLLLCQQPISLSAANQLCGNSLYLSTTKNRSQPPTLIIPDTPASALPPTPFSTLLTPLLQLSPLHPIFRNFYDHQYQSPSWSRSGPKPISDSDSPHSIYPESTFGLR